MAMATGAAGWHDYFAQPPGVTSTAGQYDLLGATPTGILDRILCRQIITVRCKHYPAIYDDMRVGTGLADYRRPSTASDAVFNKVCYL